MGITLVLDVDGAQSFEPRVVYDAISRIPGVSIECLNERDYAFFVLYRYAGDATSAYMLSNDMRFIAIEGIGPASANMAFEIQQRYPQSIYAVDLEGSFCVDISSLKSADELSAAMNAV